MASQGSNPTPATPPPNDSVPPASTPPAPPSPNSGVWSDPDEPNPHFLIQWTFQEAKPQAPGAQGAPPASGTPKYEATVRFYQSIFDATATAATPSIPFSVSDPTLGPDPILQGTILLVPDAPTLQVKNLQFSGYQGGMVNLYPPDTAAGGTTAAPDANTTTVPAANTTGTPAGGTGSTSN